MNYVQVTNVLTGIDAAVELLLGVGSALFAEVVVVVVSVWLLVEAQLSTEARAISAICSKIAPAMP